MRLFWTAAALLAATPLTAGVPADTIVAFWTTAPARRGEIPEGMPVRFALQEDGRVFVGGSREIAVGRPENKDVKAIEKQLERVRKLPVFAGPQTLGPGDDVYRLTIRKAGDIVAKGDPARASGALRPLAQLIEMLMAFEHASLRPYAPTTLLVAARETPLPGGCRRWTFPVALTDVLKEPRVVAAAQAAGWPTGSAPAVVCDGSRRYAVTLRPLMPGETP
jgi:hypothetical protein